jgi:Ser-tRNA(Ala) deacylase AlaX
MTRKLFWAEPGRTTLDTTVSAVDGDSVELAETIFFAFSGGQESDAGTIGDRPVLEARKDGLRIRYTLPAGHGLKPGDPVCVEIDGTRRRRIMRLHFAAELVLELACRKLPDVEKIGAHIAEDKARIDFAWPTSVAPLLPALAAEANALIDADHTIHTRFTDEINERRCWSIEGFAEVSCGGTHVRSTREVGTIELKRKNIGQGKERIEIRLAQAA